MNNKYFIRKVKFFVEILKKGIGEIWNSYFNFFFLEKFVNK